MIDIFNVPNGGYPNTHLSPKGYLFIGVKNPPGDPTIHAYSVRGWLFECGHFMSDDSKPDWVKCAC